MLTNLDNPDVTLAPPVSPLDAEEPACLVSIYGPGLGRRWVLDRDEVFVGRDAGCDVSLPIETVSRRHCRVRVRGESISVVDLGSTNGTAINDMTLAPNLETALRSGDRLRVGSAILKFLRGPDVEALYHEEVHRTCIEDGLTGLANRRQLEEFLDREIPRCLRHRRALSLVLIDVDHLKRVNDDFGQMSGDAVLCEIARIARTQVRREHCLARMDGDAFAVALTETEVPAARLFAERLRGTIEVHEFRAGSDAISVTISAGVAAIGPDMGERGAFVAAAETQLALAKDAGRNRSAG